jgi:O-glycosyl hydrolase
MKTRIPILLCFIVLAITQKSFGQAEVQAWGNLNGIRVQGELMAFESNLYLAGAKGSPVAITGREMQSPKFKREGASQIVTTKLGNIDFTETVTDLETGKAEVKINYTVLSDTSTTGAFFCIHLSKANYGSGDIQLDNFKSERVADLKLHPSGNLIEMEFNSLHFESAQRQITITCPDKEWLFVKPASNADNNTDQEFNLYFPLLTGDMKAGQTGTKTFVIEAKGLIDQNDIHLVLDSKNPGRTFAGFGGNFRIQNPKTDPEVIDYCLKNMRVAWGRVEMPWRYWQPDLNIDPITTAKAGHLDDHVQKAMTMAQTLQQRGIPIILTAWSPPVWAIIGTPHFNHSAGEPWGNPLNPDNTSAIYKSIADYIQYLQDQYGVQIRYFSFNESDLGIYIRQTGVEHDELIKSLGKYFAERGLKTKMLLGDNSDATTHAFIEPAMHDSAAQPFIGAVSFHSWRGWETETLMYWTNASKKIKRPLIVGEGSIDAAAWAYPAIFLESVYAMQEINLYIRLLAICQPESILQWQLTADYSPLTGGGIFGTDGPLTPTQRFWNLKQLASTAKGLHYLPISCDRASVTCAALGDPTTNTYALHIVNNGAERKVILKNLPATLGSFQIFYTSKTASMQEGPKVLVHKGETNFQLPANSFTTLTSQKIK